MENKETAKLVAQGKLKLSASILFLCILVGGSVEFYRARMALDKATIIYTKSEMKNAQEKKPQIVQEENAQNVPAEVVEQTVETAGDAQVAQEQGGDARDEEKAETERSGAEEFLSYMNEVNSRLDNLQKTESVLDKIEVSNDEVEAEVKSAEPVVVEEKVIEAEVVEPKVEVKEPEVVAPQNEANLTNTSVEVDETADALDTSDDDEVMLEEIPVEESKAVQQERENIEKEFSDEVVVKPIVEESAVQVVETLVNEEGEVARVVEAPIEMIPEVVQEVEKKASVAEEVVREEMARGDNAVRELLDNVDRVVESANEMVDEENNLSENVVNTMENLVVETAPIEENGTIDMMKDIIRRAKESE